MILTNVGLTNYEDSLIRSNIEDENGDLKDGSIRCFYGSIRRLQPIRQS